MNFKKEITYLFEKKTTAIALFLITVLGLIMYANSLAGQFIWDDECLVRDNTYIRHWSSLSKIFTSDIGASAGYIYDYYRPLQITSYLFDYSIWKLNPAGYHLTNIFLHAAVSFLLFLFIFLITKDKRTAGVGAVLYAVHPAHTGAVAYISGRPDMLAAAFTLLSLISFDAHFKAKTPKSAIAFYVVSLASFLLAILSKEISLVIPLFILCYSLFFVDRRAVEKSREIIKSNYLYWFIVIIGVYFILRIYALNFHEVGLFENKHALYSRLLTFLRAIPIYLGIIFYPVDLHMARSTPYIVSFWENGILFSVMVLVFVILVVIRMRKISKEAFFGLIFFFIALLPVSGIFPMNNNLAEHWLYVPLIGMALFASAFGVYLWDRKKALQPLLAFLFTAYFIFFSYQTVSRSFDWRDNFTLYYNTIKYSPDSVEVLNNLGNLYTDKKDYKRAIKLYKESIRIDPYFSNAYFNIGRIYNETGAPQEAIKLFNKVIDLDPKQWRAYNELGFICAKADKNEEAVKFFKKAIGVNPNYAHPYINLGMMYNKIGKKEDAIKLYETAIQLNPYLEESYYNLGNLYLKYGEDEKAIASYRKALIINEKDADAYNNLAMIYKKKGELVEAIKLLKKAIEIDPHYIKAYKNLAEIYKDTDNVEDKEF